MSRHMGKRITTTWIVILLSLNFTSAEELINPPAKSAEETSNKEEKGILATLILTYAKCRDNVKYAYDEIQYWKNMVKSYNQMEAWFKRNREKLENIKSKSREIITSKGDIFNKLERTEKLCDNIEDIAFNETRNFDHSLATFEKNYDSLASHERIRGRMVPQTNDVLNKINSFFPSQNSEYSVDPKTMESFNDTMKEALFPEASIANVSKLVAASTISKSEVYYGWSMGAISNIDSIDKKYKNIKGINQKEFQAAWYCIEQTNANNFRIRHSIEEFKIYTALLGFDLWEQSYQRGNEINNAMVFDNCEKRLTLLKNKEDIEYKKINGTNRPHL